MCYNPQKSPKKYVIMYLFLVVKEKDFTGISVTAESWIPLEGVAEPNLADYLSELKRNGWTIVAIEQENTQKYLIFEFFIGKVLTKI